MDTSDLALNKVAWYLAAGEVPAWETEYHCSSTKLVRIDCVDGVVPSYEGLRRYLQSIWETVGESFCDTSQPQTSGLGVSSSLSPGLEGGCVPHSMGSSKDLHLSLRSQS